MKRLLLSFAIASTVLFYFSACDKPTISFSEEMKNFVQSEFGNDYNGYFFREHPIGGFGAGSLYLDSDKTSKTLNDGLNLTHPDNWFRQDFSGSYPVDIFTEQEKDKINSYIISEAGMGGKSWDYSSSSKITLSLEAAIPIESILRVKPGMKLNFEKGVTIKIKIENAVMHEFSLLPFIKYGIGDTTNINPATGLSYPGPFWYSPVDLELLAASGFIIAGQDVTFEGYEAIVTIDKSVNPELYVTFDNFIKSFSDPLTPRSATTITDEEVKFGFTMTKKESGVYSVKATKPIIVAVNYHRVVNGDTLSVYMNQLLEQHGPYVRRDDIYFQPAGSGAKVAARAMTRAMVEETTTDAGIEDLTIKMNKINMSDLSGRLQKLLDY